MNEAETISTAPTPSPEELAKKSQAEALEKAAATQAKIKARADELMAVVAKGATYRRKDGANPNQRIRLISYDGIATLAGGALAHIFKAESRNPGAIWTPPATQFLADHEEVPAAEQAISQEPI